MLTRLCQISWIIGFLLAAAPAAARPTTAAMFCEAFPEVPACSGSAVACEFCHQATPPAFNPFGSAVRDFIRRAGVDVPGTPAEMRETVLAVYDLDSDGDGTNNGNEIGLGSMPGNRNSRPLKTPCVGSCKYDVEYAYKKTWLGVCGEPPDYSELKTFRAQDDNKKVNELQKLLDTCLNSNNWLGKDGVVWEIGHYKIRPVGSVKSGDDPGVMPIVDYYADYNLFIYSQINGHDAREMLLADYTVTRQTSGSTTLYTKQAPVRLTDGQVMQPEYRVGLLTSFWNLAFYLNYTGIARVLVAQAFNAYLGISLANMQGLNPPSTAESGFKDFDGKGVERPECAVCHSTLDPLAYPFRNYNGLSGTSQVLAGSSAAGLQSASSLGTEDNLTPLSYAKPRMDFLAQKYPGINAMPEAGYILGKRVANLKQWAQVMVNSDAFAANTVKDYWKVLIGHEPRADEFGEFTQLWQDFKGKHEYDVEAMLHDLIRTNAYGTP